jgi:hypothetical protein
LNVIVSDAWDRPRDSTITKNKEQTRILSMVILPFVMNGRPLSNVPHRLRASKKETYILPESPKGRRSPPVPEEK